MPNKLLINELIRTEIRQLSAYHVPPAGYSIKLDAMENPYQWDESLRTQWLQTLQTAELNRYPDPSAQQLKQQLRTVLNLPDNMDIILGNGSDELIQMLVLTFNHPHRVLLVPEPSFVMYRMISQIVGMPYLGVPLQKQNFDLDMFALLEAIETHQPALIFIAYPNNPTGNLFASEDIEAIIESTHGIVVIDEAYAPFADKTFLSHLQRYPNLLIMRTVSKLGLAGLRLGFLIGQSSWLEHIEKTRLPYNINILSQLSTTFALQHYEVLLKQAQQIKRDRQQLLQQLQKINGVQVWKSDANFLLFRVNKAPELFEQLKEKGILIKNLHNNHPLLHNCLRVTVGKPEENQIFLDTLQMLKN